MATWRKVVAALLDFFFILVTAGYAIGYATGKLTEDDFNLKGGPAFLLFGIIILYFVIFSRILDGTVWQRLLGVQ